MNMEINKQQDNAAKRPLLEVKNLRVHYETRDFVCEAVNGVSFQVNKGQMMGIVGETGAGKTTIALSIIGLLPKPPAHIIEGEILFEGEDLLKRDKKFMQHMRGSRISMIFQDPMTALNPVLRIGDQIAEVILLHNKVSKQQAQQMAKDMLEMVGIRPERFSDYPHQLSGGMKQRVVIAIALACEPDLLIADEPTTALDVTIQAQVLDLIKSLQKSIGTAMLLITHDMGIVAETCDSCAVVYAGEIVESGTVEDIFDHAVHPYSIGLFQCIPRLDVKAQRLTPIEGLTCDPARLPPCCSFYARCPRRRELCAQEDPCGREYAPGHFVKCHFPKESGTVR